MIRNESSVSFDVLLFIDRRVKAMLANAQRPGSTPEEQRRAYKTVLIIAGALALILLPILLLIFIAAMNFVFR
jgi:hypothetical protein